MWTFLQQKVVCSACIRTRSNEKKLENLFAFDFFDFVLLNKPADICKSTSAMSSKRLELVFGKQEHGLIKWLEIDFIFKE